MIEMISDYAEKKKLFRKGDRILAAVSGGADSTALLVVLQGLRERFGYELAALHVNHSLRGGAADRDEQFVKDLCREKSIPCLSYKVEVRPFAKQNHLSIEEAARILRYRAIEDAAESTGATCIAVAHHKNDQAETVLFQMIRGSGLRGLSGMAPVREAGAEFGIKNRHLRVIRPLLSVDKDEILQFLRDGNIPWCEDETNALDDASRNILRHKVIPVLTGIRPDAVEKISETAGYLAKVDAYLRQEAADWLFDNRIGAYEKEPAVTEIPAETFRHLNEVLRGVIVREILGGLRVSMKDISRTQIEAIAALSDRQVGKKVILPNGVRAERTYETVRFTVGPEHDPTEEREAEDTPVFRMETREFDCEDPVNFPKSDCTKWFDCDKINTPPELRTRREGDRFSAVPGGHKKLKDVFIDLKIPRGERDAVPIVASGSDVLWIVGHRISEEYKISPETRRVLEITVRAEEGSGQKEEE